MTLCKKWCRKNPSFNHIKTFICIAWEHDYDSGRNKLDAKSNDCIMVGYYEKYKSYRLFDLVKQEVFIRRNMISVEKSSGINFLNSSSNYIVIPLILL